jgi:hypothetical protein
MMVIGNTSGLLKGVNAPVNWDKNKISTDSNGSKNSEAMKTLVDWTIVMNPILRGHLKVPV